MVGRGWKTTEDGRAAYGSPPPRPNFCAAALGIKGWVVSGQLGRRRDPRVRLLEQPPFVRGITSAYEETRISLYIRPKLLETSCLEISEIKDKR